MLGPKIINILKECDERDRDNEDLMKNLQPKMS